MDDEDEQHGHDTQSNAPENVQHDSQVETYTGAQERVGDDEQDELDHEVVNGRLADTRASSPIPEEEFTLTQVSYSFNEPGLLSY